ncbi:MAG: dihydroneopterin aldolase [Candidatus Omnitrophota bacterium]
MRDKLFIEGLEARCVIGIFDWERKVRQKVLIDLEIPFDNRITARRDRIENALDYKRLAQRVRRFVSESRFFLIETLAEKTASMILREFPVRRLRLRLSKPGALRHSRNVGVEITRAKK